MRKCRRAIQMKALQPFGQWRLCQQLRPKGRGRIQKWMSCEKYPRFFTVVANKNPPDGGRFCTTRMKLKPNLKVYWQ